MRELHTASLLLHLDPASAGAIAARVVALGCEVHGPVTNGKMIVTLESESERDIGECLTALQLLPRVFAATLVFHHVETLTPDDRPPVTETSRCA